MRVYFTKNIETVLNDALRNVKSPIAYFLINKPVISNFSYLDVSEEDKVIITPEIKIKKIFKEQDRGGITFDVFAQNISCDQTGPAFSKYRIEIKMGRLIKRILEDNKDTWGYYRERWQENYNEKRTEDELIEEFVNQYKASTKRIFDRTFDNRIEMVKGEDIRKWYISTSYASGKGNIHESCMRHERCQEYFDIYVFNPEICSLLIFKETDSKISLRALVWTLADGSKYMDRIYASNSSDATIFINYAKRNGWLAYDYSKIENLEIKVKAMKYSKYPYMDTFRYFKPDEYFLTKKHVKTGQIHLTSQEGSYKSIN